jgi:hypothetical protein
MKVYRVNYQGKKDLKNCGYAFFPSKGKATRAKKDLDGCKGSIDIIEIGKGKQGIIDVLNEYASHPMD